MCFIHGNIYNFHIIEKTRIATGRSGVWKHDFKEISNSAQTRTSAKFCHAIS